MKGKIYSACVHGTVVYCSETQQLVRAERMMARWMCGVSLRDNKVSQEMFDRLGIVGGVKERVRRCRRRWVGHIERKSDDKVTMTGCRGADR